MRIGLLVITFSFIFFSSFAQNKKVQISPRKGWVEEQSFDPKAMPPSSEAGSYYYLLVDEQENVPLQESYVHNAYKILSNEGVQEMSDLSFVYDPAYESMIIHKIVIHRDGTALSQLAMDKIKVMQREESMDRFLYDGTMTAVVNLTDVRIGDIVEFAYTRKGYNPIYQGHITRKINFDYTVPYEKLFQKLISSRDHKFQFKNENTDIKPTEKSEGQTVSYSWSLGSNPGFIYDNHEPEWLDRSRYVLISDFSSWKEVTDWAIKLYTLPDIDKQAIRQVAESKFNSKEPEAFAVEVVRFVQDEIRYLGFEDGLNSHQPHAPMKVYEQRFGDCKDKSLLLASLLQTRNIKAYPVLVSTIWKDKVSDRLPSPFIFNHCVVQMEVGGLNYYIDPTISSQGGSLALTYFPTYGKGLVIEPQTEDFVSFPAPIKSSVSENQIFDVATIGGEAILTVETEYRGAEADGQRSSFAKNTLEKIQKNYITYYGNLYPDIEKFEDIKTEDNRETNVFIVKEKYKIPTFWKSNEAVEGQIYSELYPQSLEGYFNVTKSSQRTSPYSLIHPLDYSHHIQVNLPERWNITPQNEKLEGKAYQYQFTSTREGNEIHLYTTYKTKADHVTVEDFPQFIKDHQKMMSNLSYNLTYNKNLASGNSLNPLAVGLTLVSFLGGLWLIWWLHKNYDPTPESGMVSGKPLGGWLILIAFGITVTPFRLFYDLYSTPELLNGSSWSGLIAQGRYGLFAFLFFEHVYNVLYLLFSILIVVLFYQRRSSLPLLICISYFVSLVVTSLDVFVTTTYLNSEDKDTYRDLIRIFVATVIWIPYFIYSVRVKETFVYRANSNKDGGMSPQPVPHLNLGSQAPGSLE